ncbi:siderophore-interacting protein [Antrihabitans sp. YC2-6]|uniref:siderophore-interacting protein n=1 Tax=Antrihabitans sp. YC2-6 TaxID=2799498 RepID=UPI0018F709DD|nr:siderophore-interacting protein [Antrihabitans sp. YC2-6]MBJ8347923.1 siderophore-interacting protein [Antrihabitans sp. YC2-6]
MSKYVKPAERQILSAVVVASKQVSPSFVRLTLGGEGLDNFTPMGYDQWFRMFFPKKDQSELRLPTKASNLWYAQYLLMSKDSRPGVRNYTVRDFRSAGKGEFGDTPELDIDFAVHGDIGIIYPWITAVSPGDEVALLDEGITYAAPDDAEWTLLVGEESALPAIIGILNSAPRDLRAEVFIEIPDADDKQTFDAPEGANIHWVVRTDHDAKPGALVAETVRTATLPDGQCYAFIAGESELAKGMRRFLVNDKHVPKSHVNFTGYWKQGRAAG